MIHKKRMYRNTTEINQPDTPQAETGKVWSWIDNFLQRADTATDLAYKIKTGEPVPNPATPTYQVKVGRDESEIGIFGIPKPWGAVIIVVFAGSIGYALYKMNKK